MRACSPPTISASWGTTMPVCGGVKAYNERSFCVKYRSQGYKLYFTSPLLLLQTPWEIRSPEGSQKIQGMQEQISLMLQKNAISEISPDTPESYSSPIPGTQGIWRMAPSYRLKRTEPPHRRSSLLHAHYKLSAEYHRKRRLGDQNRSAGCVLSCTDTSGQQEVPTFCLRKQGIPVLSTSILSEHCPSGIYPPGTYSGSLPPSSRDIGHSISRRLVDTSSRPPSVTLPSVLVAKHTEHGRPQVKRSKIRTRTSSGYPVSGASTAFGSGESFPLSIQSSGVMVHACRISSQKTLS